MSWLAWNPSSAAIGELFVVLVYHFVSCDSDNHDDGSPSTTDVSCSPRWIVYPRSRTHGASWNTASDLQQCLDACVSNPRCHTAESLYIHDHDNIPSCWLHMKDASQKREHHRNIVQFDIVRQCYDPTSSTWRHHTLFYIIFSGKFNKWLIFTILQFTLY